MENWTIAVIVVIIIIIIVVVWLFVARGDSSGEVPAQPPPTQLPPTQLPRLKLLPPPQPLPLAKILQPQVPQPLPPAEVLQPKTLPVSPIMKALTEIYKKMKVSSQDVPELPNYRFVRGKQMRDYNVRVMGAAPRKGQSINELAKTCDSLPDCVAFNFDETYAGAIYDDHLLQNIPGSDLQNHPDAGIYIRKSAIPIVPKPLNTYKFTRGVSMPSPEPPLNFKSLDAAQNAMFCDRTPGCIAFNSLGLYYTDASQTPLPVAEWADDPHLGLYAKP